MSEIAMDSEKFNNTLKQLLTLINNRSTVGDAEFYRRGNMNYLTSKLFCNEIKKDISSFERFVKNGTILDLGCGVGYLSAFLAKEGFSCVGLDVDVDIDWYTYSKPKNVRIIWRSQIWKEIEKLFSARFQLYNGTNIPFIDSSFDAVICYQLIEHIPCKKLNAIFSEIWRILKPKGILFISQTPRRQSYAEHLVKIMGLRSHKVLLNERSVKKVLVESRFKILTIERLGMIPVFSKKLTNLLFRLLSTIDNSLLYTPLNYFAHHMRIVAEKSLYKGI